jgi:hypothetical protein
MLASHAPPRRRLLAALLLTTGFLGAALGKWIVDGNAPLFWITLTTLVSVVARGAMMTTQGQNFLVDVGDALIGARARHRARIAAVQARTAGTGVLETPNGVAVFYSDDRTLLEVIVRAFALAGRDCHPDGNNLVGGVALREIAVDSTVRMAYRDVPALAPITWRRTADGLRFEPPGGLSRDVAPDRTFIIQTTGHSSDLSPARRAALLERLSRVRASSPPVTPERPPADPSASPPRVRRSRAGTQGQTSPPWSDNQSGLIDVGPEADESESERARLLDDKFWARKPSKRTHPDSDAPTKISGAPK